MSSNAPPPNGPGTAGHETRNGKPYWTAQQLADARNNPAEAQQIQAAQNQSNSSLFGSIFGPSPQEVAQAQADASKQVINAQTQANRPNINGPVGSMQWTQDANGNWTLNQGFSPQFAGAAGTLGSQAAANMSTPFDMSRFGPLDNGSAARDQAISASYNQSASRLNPQWAQRDEQLNASLANQGLDPNSQAARAAQLQEGQQRNDAYSSAMNDAIKNGVLAQEQTFNQNLQTRQQAIMEALKQRGMPLEELQQLQAMSGAPQFNQAAASSPPNLLGAYQMQQQQAADTAKGVGEGMSGLAALIAAMGKGAAAAG